MKRYSSLPTKNLRVGLRCLGFRAVRTTPNNIYIKYEHPDLQRNASVGYHNYIPVNKEVINLSWKTYC